MVATNNNYCPEERILDPEVMHTVIKTTQASPVVLGKGGAVVAEGFDEGDEEAHRSVKRIRDRRYVSEENSLAEGTMQSATKNIASHAGMIFFSNK